MNKTLTSVISIVCLFFFIERQRSTLKFLNKSLQSRLTVVPRRWGSEPLEFAIKQVDNGQISTEIKKRTCERSGEELTLKTSASFSSR